MSFLPKEFHNEKISLNLAPMIDFIFLLLVFFATLAVSRVATQEADIQLASIKRTHTTSRNQAVKEKDRIINISVSSEGKYKWNSNLRDYEMPNAEAVATELEVQHQRGLLPEDKSKTKVLMRVDANASWETVLGLLFAVRDAGFDAKPLYVEKEPLAH